MPRYTRLLLMTSSVLACAAAVFHAADARAEFDPNAGAVTYPATATPLPNTRVLQEEFPIRPLYHSGTYARPLTPISMPKPLYPARNEVAAPVAPAPAAAAVTVPAPSPAMPALPPVDPAVAARAQAMMQADTPPAPAVLATPVSAPAVAPTNPTFVAPAPLPAATPAVVVPAAAPVASAATPMVVKAPVIVPATALIKHPAVAAQPPVATVPAAATPAVMVPETNSDTLSNQTRAIISAVPSKLDSPPPEKPTKVNLNRVSPQIQDVLGAGAKEDTFESVGLSISVRRPGLDTNYELNQAYTALMGGDTERAIAIYKNVLGSDPTNQDALFGLAATYHRTGSPDKARPYYGMLLKINPNHREALNNFLVLVSDESPQDALPELERLELRNPDFSPIPAQIAIVYDKLGYPDKAEDKLLRAIELAPENLTYKYNLATMMDHHRRYADAIALYRMLIAASLRGEDVPAPADALQRRMNYITTAATEGRLGS